RSSPRPARARPATAQDLGIGSDCISCGWTRHEAENVGSEPCRWSPGSAGSDPCPWSQRPGLACRAPPAPAPVSVKAQCYHRVGKVSRHRGDSTCTGCDQGRRVTPGGSFGSESPNGIPMFHRLLLVASLPLTLAAAQGEEKAFSPEGAGFSILFPGAPTEHKQRVETPAGTIEVTLYVFEPRKGKKE